MTLFWFSVAALMALALVFIVPPFFRKHETQHVSEDELNLAVIKQQLEELKADLDSGELDRDQYEAARHDLEKELLADLSAGSTDPTPLTGDPKAGRWAIALLVVAIPAISLPLYFKYGSPSLIPRLEMGDTGRTANNAAGHSAGGQQSGSMLEMIDQLAKKLEQSPNNPDGWKMLARSYMAVNRIQDALNAYEAAYKLAPEDADLILAYGTTLAQSNNNQFAGRPTELISQALELSPQDPNAQWLRGIAYFQEGDYANAVVLWERVLTHLPAGSPEAQNVTEYLNEARAQLPPGSQPASGVGSTPAMAQQSAPAKPAAASSGRIRVEVSLDPALRDKVEGSDLVFIFARAVSGPRMPLAAMKRQVKDLPVTLELDDSMAMMPQFVLSKFPEVVVGARISKSGDPVPKSGDLEGEVSPVVPGQEATVQVVVNTIHP